MPQKNINQPTVLSSNSAIELLSWPVSNKLETGPRKNKVFAFQTNRLTPENSSPKNKSSKKNSFVNHYSPYEGFNLGFHVDDNVESVTNNRIYLQARLQENLADKVTIQWLEQVHGNKVVEVNQDTNETLIADASITREKNIALAIMTADCLPILLCDTYGTEIAAIHGGWRSLAANIIKNTLAKVHSNINDIQVWLGPCIGHNAFEVGEEVKLAFTQKNVHFDKAFVQQNNGKFLADLHLIAKQQLADLGIKKVTMLAECTYHNTEKFYSYRRESITGRMASIICLSQ